MLAKASLAVLLAAPALAVSPSPQVDGQLLERVGATGDALIGIDAEDGRYVTSWLSGTTAKVQLWSPLPGTSDLALEAAFDGPTNIVLSTAFPSPEVRLGPDGQVIHGVRSQPIRAYRPDGAGGWAAQIIPSPIVAPRFFGTAFDVDMEARRMVIATEAFSQHEYAVAVYALPLGASDWVLEDLLTEPRVSSAGATQLDLAIDGEHVVIGYRSSSQLGGAVTVHRLDSNGNFAGKTSVAPTASVLDRFGTAVAVDGDHLLVSARRNNGTGIVSAYRLGGAGSWNPIQEFNDGAFQPVDRFGVALAVDGDVAIVGGPGVSTQTESVGIAGLFRFNGSSWQAATELRDGSPAPGDTRARGFGSAVAVHDDGVRARALVGGERRHLAPTANPVPFVWAEEFGTTAVPDRPVYVTAGVPFCEPPANSSGATGRLRCVGTSDVSATNYWGFSLEASGLPSNTFAIFTLADHMQPSPVGPFGLLCANAPALWRLTAPLITDGGGRVSAGANPFALPVGGSSVAATIGSTWTFQLLARDTGGVTATTAVAVTFR